MTTEPTTPAAKGPASEKASPAATDTPAAASAAGTTTAAGTSTATTTADESATSTADPMKPLPSRSWWHRHLEPEERRRVMKDLAIIRQEHWAYRFNVMLTLSVIVAVMGLSANSAAVVIGAMLLAPLMSPVLATAGCLSMALFKKAAWWFTRVVMASAWAIALAFALAAILPNGSTLGSEVVSRTAPDIRDLIVALGAGAAGAYATVRRDASAALPGVAVAVALVPPLAAVGITLEAGNRTFAQGALLLYTTNLAAIILAGVVVFVITGFVPPRRLAMTSGRLIAAAVAAAAVVAAITVPLYRASTTAAAASDEQIVAQAIVDDWLGEITTTRAPTIEFNDGRILISIRSFESPIDADSLQSVLRSRFGDDIAVSIEWDKVERATTTTTAAPTTTVVTDEELLLADVTAIVDTWLADNDPTDRREQIVINGSEVRIDATGAGAPPSVSDLVQRLDDAIDQTLEVRLTWVERQNISADAEPTPVEIQSQQMEITTEVWAADNDVDLRTFMFTGEQVEIELTGIETPDTNDLVLELQEITGEETPVVVYFTKHILVTTTSTVATTTTTN